MTIAPSGDAVTTFDINGTASGQYIHEGIYDQYGIPLASWYQEFRNGRIYRDVNTNEIAGMSESMSSYSVSMNPDPTASHGWMFIDYNGFTSFANGVDNVINKTYVLSFSEPHKMYYETFIPHKATIDYYGTSIGVTFGEAEPIDPALFDSGIDKFLPEQQPPTYEPHDLSSAFLPQQTPMQAFWGSIHANSHNALDVAGMLPIVGAPADALNATVYFAEGDYVNGTMSVAGMVPGAGEAVIGAKLLNKGAKVAKKANAASDLGKQAIKHADDVPGHLKQAKNGIIQNCFTAGTQVVVGMEYDADGNFVSYVTVNIEDVQAGDLVYSYNTLTGETELCEATATFVRTSDHINYLTIVDEHGHEQVIETTDGHPFWVVTNDPDMSRAARDYVFENGLWLYHEDVTPTEHGYWVEAKDLRIGDVFIGANGELSTLINIVRVEQDGGIAVFNFSVEGNHNYYIFAKEYEYGQSCVLVHNAEYVQRWMSDAELRATEATGLLRGGRDGTHYVTDAANISAIRARARLSLKSTPEVRVTLEVPDGKFSLPTRVDPLHNMPGGGMERMAEGPISVKIIGCSRDFR